MQYRIYSARIDVEGGAQHLCTLEGEDAALSMLVYYRKAHEGHSLHTPDGDVPYNSVMRWYMFPVSEAPQMDRIGRLIPAKGLRRVR